MTLPGLPQRFWLSWGGRTLAFGKDAGSPDASKNVRVGSQRNKGFSTEGHHLVSTLVRLRMKGITMWRGSVPRIRLSIAAGLLLPLLALLVWTPTPASAAATDSISAVVQTCTLPVGASCDPTQPINGADWATSATAYGSEVWWRVVVTNTGTDPLTDIEVSSSLPLPSTDCSGPVPVPGNSLAVGASYGYVCETTNLTQTVTAVADAPSGPITSAPSTGTAQVESATPPPGAAITAVLQICILANQASCDPSQPINGADWASSETLNQTTARWRVFVTNTGTVPLTTLVATDGLAQTDCGGVVPMPTDPLVMGASLSYECQTDSVTQTTTNTVTVSAFPSPYPSGAPVTSPPSSATAIVASPTTAVLFPFDWSIQSGRAAVLDASASANVTSVNFTLAGWGVPDHIISAAVASPYGWLGRWNTTTVPNGIYVLRSVASYANGQSGTSRDVLIFVFNF
jgi:hypothetical protein